LEKCEDWTGSMPKNSIPAMNSGQRQAGPEQRAQVSNSCSRRPHISAHPPIPDTGGKISPISVRVGTAPRSGCVARRAWPASAWPATTTSFEVQRTNLIFGKDNLGRCPPSSEGQGHLRHRLRARVNSPMGCAANESLGRQPGLQRLRPQQRDQHELAVLAPYDLTIQCFSAELGRLLAGFTARCPSSFSALTSSASPSTAICPARHGR
jgi:hypothetical protein